MKFSGQGASASFQIMSKEPVVGNTVTTLCFPVSLWENFKKWSFEGGHKVFIWFHFTETN